MAQGLIRGFSLWVLGALVFLGGPRAFAYYEGRSPIPVSIEELRKPAKEPESLLDFFQTRTKIGVGFEEAFNDNVFAQDNNKQEDYISTMEGQILFADPRGALLYGASYEANAFRYHIKRVNAIDHDFRAFLDIETAGLNHYSFDYTLVAKNRLLLGPGKIDILRRSTDFQRDVEHTWKGTMNYALHETVGLSSQLEYKLFDDQSQEDAETDRKSLRAFLDMSRQFKPGWDIYSGYEFSDIEIPGNKPKSSNSHGIRIGTKYELREIINLGFLFKFERREFESKQKSDNHTVETGVTYELGPRTTLGVGYTDERITSFAVGRLQFRSKRSGMGVTYRLTPLTEATFGAGYEKQTSGGSDALTGSTSSSVTQRSFSFTLGAKWQIRPKASITLDYGYGRSKSRDTTTQVTTLGFEAEL